MQAVIENRKTKETRSEEFDTVIFAVGRKATTHSLNLDHIGVKKTEQQNRYSTGRSGKDEIWSTFMQ